MVQFGRRIESKLALPNFTRSSDGVGQPNDLVIQRHGGSDSEREFYRQSLVENELLQRRLDKLTDVLIARRHARGAP